MSKTPILDLHSHMLINLSYLRKDLSKRVKSPLLWNPLKNHLDLQKIKEGGYKGLVFNIYVPGFMEGLFHREALRQFRVLEEFVAKNSSDLHYCRNFNDIVKAEEEGKIAVIPAIEGGHVIKSPDDIALFKEKGTFYLTLTHFIPNRIARSCTFQIVPSPLITSLGRKVIKEMEKFGIIPDLAHIAEKAFYKVADFYNGPLFVSHAAVRKFHDSERNLSDKQIKLIGDRDGLIGIIMFPWYLNKTIFADASIWAKTAAHIANLIGADRVALGSDFDGYIWSVRGVRDASQIQNLRYYLEKEGFTNEEIEKILWKNAYEFLRKYYK